MKKSTFNDSLFKKKDTFSSVLNTKKTDPPKKDIFAKESD